MSKWRSQEAWRWLKHECCTQPFFVLTVLFGILFLDQLVKINLRASEHTPAFPEKQAKQDPKELFQLLRQPDPSWTPLHAAAMVGDWQAVDRLSRVKAHVNAKDRKTLMPPLWFAAINGHGKAAEILADRGANVSYRGPGGFNALSAAVCTKQEGLIFFLLLRGAPLRGDDLFVCGSTLFHLQLFNAETHEPISGPPPSGHFGVRVANYGPVSEQEVLEANLAKVPPEVLVDAKQAAALSSYMAQVPERELIPRQVAAATEEVLRRIASLEAAAGRPPPHVVRMMGRGQAPRHDSGDGAGGPVPVDEDGGTCPVRPAMPSHEDAGDAAKQGFLNEKAAIQRLLDENAAMQGFLDEIAAKQGFLDENAAIQGLLDETAAIQGFLDADAAKQGPPPEAHAAIQGPPEEGAANQGPLDEGARTMDVRPAVPYHAEHVAEEGPLDEGAESSDERPALGYNDDAVNQGPLEGALNQWPPAVNQWPPPAVAANQGPPPDDAENQELPPDAQGAWTGDVRPAMLYDEGAAQRVPFDDDGAGISGEQPTLLHHEDAAKQQGPLDVGAAMHPAMPCEAGAANRGPLGEGAGTNAVHSAMPYDEDAVKQVFPDVTDDEGAGSSAEQPSMPCAEDAAKHGLPDEPDVGAGASEVRAAVMHNEDAATERGAF